MGIERGRKVRDARRDRQDLNIWQENIIFLFYPLPEISRLYENVKYTFLEDKAMF